MDENQILQKMHALQLMLADELKRICEKHEITYFMIAGTLLGAVRHKGFIPWDDDMDFGMRRDDFEKFLSVAESELDNSIFYLQTDRVDKYYTFSFAKLRLRNTSVIESFSSLVKTDQGIYIDIFPIDNVSDNNIIAWIDYKIFWVFRNVLWIKCGYGSQERRRKISYKVVHAVSKLFSIDFLKNIKFTTITKHRGTDTRCVVTTDGAYGLKKETIKSDLVKQLCDYPFEDRIFPGIKDYGSYLTQYYGDYMKLPPLDKRNHHNRIKVDFGPYSE